MPRQAAVGTDGDLRCVGEDAGGTPMASAAGRMGDPPSGVRCGGRPRSAAGHGAVPETRAPLMYTATFEASAKAVLTALL